MWRTGRHILAADKLAVFCELRERAMDRFDTDGDGNLDAAERAAARATVRPSLP